MCFNKRKFIKVGAKFTNNFEGVNSVSKLINVPVNDKLIIRPNYIETDLLEQEKRTIKENDVIVNKEKFVSIQYLKEHYHFGTDYNLGHHVIDQSLGH